MPIRSSFLSVLASGSRTVDPVYKAHSYERVTADQSAVTDARIARFRTRFDSSDNQYVCYGDGNTSVYLTRWAKIDSNNNLQWSKYVTVGQSTLDRPYSVTSVFPNNTATSYYVIGISPNSNAQGYGLLVVTKFDMTTHAVQWNCSYSTILTRGSTAGRNSPQAVYDRTDDTIYITSDVQVDTTSTSYFGLHKLNGSDGSVAWSKTSGNGDVNNQGNQNPITSIEQFGSYIYVGTFLGNQLCVAKFAKSDAARVWAKVTVGLGTGAINTQGPAMTADQNGDVYIAANRALTDETILIRVDVNGNRMDYLTVPIPSYGTMTGRTLCGLSAESIVVDNERNIFITYGSRVATGYTATATNMIIGRINFNRREWTWLKAVDIIRQDTDAVIGISNGWAIAINKNLIYASGTCDVTAAGLLGVDNNGQWQTLELRFDRDGKLITNGSFVGTFAANRRAIKMVDITKTTITFTSYAGTASTAFATLINTSAAPTNLTWTVSDESTDYVNKYN